MERSLVLLKPDTVQRGLVGRIIQRFEDVGLKIVGMKMVWIDDDFAKKHYFDVAERHGEAILQANVEFLTMGPIVAIVFEGVGAVPIIRKLVGGTYPDSANPGTIRGDFSHHNKEWTDRDGRAIRNLVHASGSVDEAKIEIDLWFKPEELQDYKVDHEKHTF